MTEITGQLWLYSPTGELLSEDVPFSTVEWTLEENAFHVLRATGPMGGEDGIDPALFRLDSRFELHRFIDGQALGIEGETQFFLRYWSFGEDDQGAQTWTIEAYSPEYFLNGRIIDSFASLENDINPLTTKSGAGDDLIKAWVRENIGESTATATRKVAEWVTAADTTLAPTTDKSAAWDNLFSTILALADDALYRGTYLSFGLVADGDGSGFTFRTWINQRGIDHTAGTGNEVIVSAENGNLRAGRVEYDHRQEITAIRALGNGEGRARTNTRVEDTARSLASPWAYREASLQTQAETAATLTTDANAALQRGQPLVSFTGKFIDTDYARYGDRVKFGDLVTAESMGMFFTCRLSRIAGKWSAAGEELDIDLLGTVDL